MIKILVIGQPKSGTSMLAAKIKAGLDFHYGVKSQLLFEPKLRDGVLEIKKFNVTKVLYSPNPNHVFNYDRVQELGNLFDKKIIICRDPRDILVSNTLYRWFHKHKPKPEHFQKALDLVQKKEAKPSSVNLYEISSINIHRGMPKSLETYASTIQKEYEQFADTVSQIETSDWFPVKYEDVVSNHTKYLNQYLEFDISEDIAVVEKTAFARTARTKSYGNWRNWFTQDDIAFFKPIFEKSLQKLGYDSSDWGINSEQKIESKTSSEYMIKLFASTDD
ncbi:MAG TPA: sulfotransferase domain-containing protein [Oscillatoriales cyanobacterium M59_W2019_021]|nr:sulfotransferase domain-containing protein [Oscillatoriales cyanobacterium M4454_W2019_049]HIK50943.1 sulfotransferase domain-containing protein [Oscillatoriales cyanobacterium M59_W2019_021]